MTEYKPRERCQNCGTGRSGGVCTCRPAKTRRPGRGLSVVAAVAGLLLTGTPAWATTSDTEAGTVAYKHYYAHLPTGPGGAPTGPECWMVRLADTFTWDDVCVTREVYKGLSWGEFYDGPIVRRV